ncbi:MAG: hypothetical protein M5U34_48275 [Chloroflexi bacterium]|nr:hypothetical protein [Chloroflexota bacterium]
MTQMSRLWRGVYASNTVESPFSSPKSMTNLQPEFAMRRPQWWDK